MVETTGLVRRPRVQNQLRWVSQAQQRNHEGAAPAAAVPSTGESTGATSDASQGGEAPAASPVYETLSDDDRIIHELRAEHAAKTLAPTPAPPATQKKRAEGAGAEESGAKPGAEPAPATPATTAIVKYESGEAAVTAIVAAIESGDAKKIAKALGKPDSFVEVSDAKWMAFREQQNAVRQRDKHLTQREHEFNTRLAEARTEFGAAIKAAKAYRDGNYAEFVTLVRELTGDAYDDAQRKVIEGEIAVDPSVRKLREELAALRAEQAKEREEARKAQQTEQQKAQYERAVEAVSQELVGHRVAKVKGYQREVLNRVRESWDPAEKAYTMSFAEAADAIMAERDAEAEALGYQRPAPALPAAPSAPALPAAAPTPSVPPRARAADARPADLEPWADPKAPDMDDDQIIESIKNDIKTGRLKP